MGRNTTSAIKASWFLFPVVSVRAKNAFLTLGALAVSKRAIVITVHPKKLMVITNANAPNSAKKITFAKLISLA